MRAAPRTPIRNARSVPAPTQAGLTLSASTKITSIVKGRAYDSREYHTLLFQQVANVVYPRASGSSLVELLTEGRLKVVLFVGGTADRLMTSPSIPRVLMVSICGSFGWRGRGRIW